MLLNNKNSSKLPTKSMWYEVEEGISQQPTRSETEQHLEQVLVLVAVGLNWDQKQDEERSRTDEQGGSDSLQTMMEGSLQMCRFPAGRKRHQTEKHEEKRSEVIGFVILYLISNNNSTIEAEAYF